MSLFFCYKAGVLAAIAHLFVGKFMVKWHLTMELCTAKCHEWACNIAKTMTSNGKQFTVTAKCCRCCTWSECAFQNSLILLLESYRVFPRAWVDRFVLLYDKSLIDWTFGERWILFPSNLNVPSWIALRFSETNSLLPSGPVIRC